MLETVLSALLGSLSLFLAIAASILAVVFSKYFEGSPFEKCCSSWRTLFLIPILLAAIIFVELLGINILRLRSLLAVGALVVFTYTYYSFYKTVSFVQPYKGQIRAKVETDIDKARLEDGKEKILIEKEIYEKLAELAEQRGMTINQLIYTVILPEWVASRKFNKQDWDTRS